jgi:hypothetical protein
MNRIAVLNALDSLIVPDRDRLVHADLLHAEINRVLLDLGQDTVSRNELHDLLHVDLDYHDVLDDHGRVVWKGLAMLSEKMETPGVLDGVGVWEHPVVSTTPTT